MAVMIFSAKISATPNKRGPWAALEPILFLICYCDSGLDQIVRELPQCPLAGIGFSYNRVWTWSTARPTEHLVQDPDGVRTIMQESIVYLTKPCQSGQTRI